MGRYILAAIVLLLLVIGGLITWAKYRPSPVPTAANFVEDIVAAQYIAAYVQTSSTFQAHETQAQFSRAEASLTDITGVVSGVSLQSATGTEDTVIGQIRYSSAQNKQTDQFTIHLIWAHHIWQVDSFSVT